MNFINRLFFSTASLFAWLMRPDRDLIVLFVIQCLILALSFFVLRYSFEQMFLAAGGNCSNSCYAALKAFFEQAGLQLFGIFRK